MLLSVCLLLKDEAECLRRIATSLEKLADEIVVVCDDPPSESLRQTAAQCGARLVPHRWQNDFAAARNAGLDAASGEWVFWIDGDETLLAPDASAIRKLLGRPDVLCYYVNIEDITGATTLSTRRHPSVYRRREEMRYRGRIHEHFEPLLTVTASRLGLTVENSPIRLRHTGYDPALRPHKLARNLALLELELADRPGELYYLIELGRTLLMAGQSRGHDVLAEAAQIIRPLLCQPEAPTLPVAGLLEYALSHAAQNFPLSRADAAAAAARWFPVNPPLMWRAARWHYERGKFTEAAELLQRILELGESGEFDDGLSFDRRIFGDETRLNLGVCRAKLGQIAQAKEELQRIQPGSSFFALAKANLEQL